jgi:uncharacterized protein (TIGR02145 family)
MKIKKVIITISLSLMVFGLNAQSVGINATGTPADNSAILDLDATNKGFLITRVDTANIASPAFGLMTLSPADSCLYLYNGARWMGMGGGGTNCSCNCSNDTSSNSITYPPGSVFCPTASVIQNVTNPTTGKIWMDRNLGASQVATSPTDVASYGSLYQWGRFSDGHQCRTSLTDNTLATTEVPNGGNSWDGKFILVPNPAKDWLAISNNSLWQGVNGINNPCPSGYRLPTDAEWNAEAATWSSFDAAGAFSSVLKLPQAGFRLRTTGAIFTTGTADYWSSNALPSQQGGVLEFNSTGGFVGVVDRGSAVSVRCIKD